MSLERKQLRVEIRNIEEITELKRKRKNILKNLTKEVKEIKEKQVDAILHDLESVNNDCRMFKAVKEIHRKPSKNPTIYNDKGKVVIGPQTVHKIIQNHSKNHFHEDV